MTKASVDVVREDGRALLSTLSRRISVVGVRQTLRRRMLLRLALGAVVMVVVVMAAFSLERGYTRSRRVLRLPRRLPRHRVVLVVSVRLLVFLAVLLSGLRPEPPIALRRPMSWHRSRLPRNASYELKVGGILRSRTVLLEITLLEVRVLPFGIIVLLRLRVILRQMRLALSGLRVLVRR